MTDRAEYSFDVFISFAGADSAWVQGYLLPALSMPEKRTITRQSFRPGAPLVAEFERAVTGSRYTLLILTPAYLADEWSSLGENLASHLTIVQQQERLIPLLLKPCELPLRIDFRVRLDCTDRANKESEIARLRKLLDQPEPVLREIKCPYPGMVPFNAEDARFFYGREAEIDEMLQRLRHQGYLFVIGDSGSGKSSLIMAGLLPRLHETTLFPEGYWLVRMLRPGNRPLQTLAEVVGPDLAQPSLVVSDLLADHPPAQRLLLVIDQFEELFTQASRPEQSQFIATLQALRAIESCALVIALRGDFFYTDLTSSALWPVAPSERLEIAPLRDAALRDAIVKPAGREDVYLEPELVELLLRDAADERGVLPLVQEAMVQLWDRMERRLISLSAYEQLGGGGRSGLAGALVTKANGTLDQLPPDQQIIARRIFLRLVQFGEGRPDTRRQQPESALRSWNDDPQTFGDTLQHLAENRLLTLSGEGAGNDRKVDIAHEALFTQWPRLENWVSEWRGPEQTRRKLEAWATDWNNRNRDPKALLNEVELSQANEWLKSPTARELGHSEALPRLVEASQAALDEEAARRQRNRRFQLGALVAIALLIIAVLTTVVVSQRQVTQEQEKAVATAKAFGQAQQAARATAEAERQRAEDLARDLLLRHLLLQSESLLEDHFDHSLLLSIEAFRLADTVETRNNLLQVLRAWPELVRYFHDVDMPTVSAFSPDGETLVALTGSGIELWDASTGAAIEPVSSVINGSTVSSRDGKTGFSAESDTILVWDLASDQSPYFLGGRQSDSISPDGKILASWLENGVIGLKDVKTGSQLGELRDGWLEYGYTLTFSPDSRILVTASSNSTDPPMETVLAWELPPFLTDYWELDEGFSSREADDRWSFCGEDCASIVGSVTNIIFSSDGQLLTALVQENIDVHYLLLSRRNPIELWQGEPNVTSLTSNCDNSFALGREDGKIVFFDIAFSSDIGADLTSSRSPLNHPGSVEALVFSPGCHRLASLGSSEIVLWDVGARDVPLPFGLIDTRPAMDGTSIAAWDYSGAVSWSSPDGKMTATSECIRTRTQLDPTSHCIQSAISGGYAGFTGIVTSLAKSPDGRTLVAGICREFDIYLDDNDPEQCYLGEVWLWPAGPNDAVYLGDQEYAVTDLIFSPDGKAIASVGQDGTIMYWDVDPELLTALACYRANLNLTDDEWTGLGFDPPDSPTCPSLEGPDRSRWVAALRQIEPLLPTPAPTVTPGPARTPTPTATPRNPPGGGG